VDRDAVLKVVAELRDRAERVGASLGELNAWSQRLETAAADGGRGGVEPAAYLVPRLLTFKGVRRTSCPVEMQPIFEGTVAWEASLIGDAHPVTDKDGVTHHTKPLYTAHPAPSAGVDGWKSIETAPKSYHPPLSQYNHHAPDILGLFGKAFYCVCHWGGSSQPFWIDRSNRRIPMQPTHWMPLPAAPSTEGQRS